MAVVSESWIDARRAKTYPRLVLALYLALGLAWVAMSHDFIDREGKPLGGDFIIFYAGSALALQGEAAAAYDPGRMAQAEQAAVPASTTLYPWFYPPTYQLLVLPLALLPYLASFLLFMALTLGCYLWLIREIAPDGRAIPIALAFTGTFVNLVGGQNGFLSTALLGAALLLVETRPILAGLLTGLLAYKPHLAILLPFVFAAGGYWRGFAAAAASAFLFVALSVAVFGIESWQLFWAQLPSVRQSLETGALPLDKMVSVFAAARLLGAPAALAYLAQALVALVVLVATILAWRRASDLRLRAALAAAATPLLSPYLFDYDLTLLAVPIALLAVDGISRGWLPGLRTVLLAAWLAPMLAVVFARYLHLPITPVILLALFGFALRRLGQSPGAPALPASSTRR